LKGTFSKKLINKQIVFILLYNSSKARVILQTDLMILNAKCE